MTLYQNLQRFIIFYSEQTELNDTLLYEAEQQEPVISQNLFFKRYKNCFSIPPLIFVQTNDR